MVSDAGQADVLPLERIDGGLRKGERRQRTQGAREDCTHVDVDVERVLAVLRERGLEDRRDVVCQTPSGQIKGKGSAGPQIRV